MAREKGFLALFCFAEDFASAEATKGFPIAFGNLRGPPLDAEGFSTRNGFLVDGKEKGLLAFSVSQGFASAEATKGLSDRPLETFGAHLLRRIGFSTRMDFLWMAREKGFLALFCFAGFRLCGGDQRAFRSPFGNLRGPPLEADRVFYRKWISCGWQGKGPPCFFCFAGFRLCGGDQRAFRSPFGNLRGPPLDADRVFYKKWISCGWQGKGPPCFFCFAGFRLCGGDQRAFRSPFGNLRGPPLDADRVFYKKWISCGWQGKRASLLFLFRRISPLRRRPKGFPLALWKPSGWLPAYKHFCSLLLLKFRDKSNCKKPHCSTAMWLL